MDNLAEFWRARYQKFGHTGWKNTLIYAYDQQERLHTVSSVIDSLLIDPPAVLDFGCGTGDFSRLLLKKGFDVYGYDPYVRPAISDSNFVYAQTPADLVDSGKVGLILSITVLDHILNDDELEHTFAFLNEVTAERSHLLLIEYATDEECKSPQPYQAYRSLTRWRHILKCSGWHIRSIKPFAHPINAPSPGFQLFLQSATVRVMKRLLTLRPRSAPLRSLLSRYASIVVKRSDHGFVEGSPLKLMVCSRRRSDTFAGQ